MSPTIILTVVAVALFFAQSRKPKTGLKKVSFSIGGIMLVLGAFCTVFGGFMPLPNGFYVIAASSIPLLISIFIKNPAADDQ